MIIISVSNKLKLTKIVIVESEQYEKKMVWLQGLANIHLGRIVEFLEPIASGSNSESRHLRVAAAWASLPTAPLRPDVVISNNLFFNEIQRIQNNINEIH